MAIFATVCFFSVIFVHQGEHCANYFPRQTLIHKKINNKDVACCWPTSSPRSFVTFHGKVKPGQNGRTAEQDTNPQAHVAGWLGEEHRRSFAVPGLSNGRDEYEARHCAPEKTHLPCRPSHSRSVAPPSPPQPKSMDSPNTGENVDVSAEPTRTQLTSTYLFGGTKSDASRVNAAERRRLCEVGVPRRRLMFESTDPHIAINVTVVRGVLGPRRVENVWPAVSAVLPICA